MLTLATYFLLKVCDIIRLIRLGQDLHRQALLLAFFEGNRQKMALKEYKKHNIVGVV